MNQKQSKKIRKLCKKYGLSESQYKELKSHYKNLSVKNRSNFLFQFEDMIKKLQSF